MIIFNCTKAAADFLSPPKRKNKSDFIQSVPDIDVYATEIKNNAVSQWLVQYAIEAGKDVLFVCHTQYRFSMIFTEIKKEDWQGFIHSFWEKLFEHLFFLVNEMPFFIVNEPMLWLEHFRFRHQDKIIFCKRFDARTATSIKNIRYEFDRELYNTGKMLNSDKVISLERWVNGRPTYCSKIKDIFFPANELLCDFLAHDMHINNDDISIFQALSFDHFEQGMMKYFDHQFDIGNKQDDYLDDIYLQDKKYSSSLNEEIDLTTTVSCRQDSNIIPFSAHSKKNK